MVTNIVKDTIASFLSPKAADIRSLKVYFSPVQMGSGDPSPTNIRAVTGRTGLTFSRCGKNVFDETYPGIVSSPATYRPIYVGDGTFTASTDLGKNSGNGANIFLLPGSVSSGGSTNTYGVWTGQPRTATAVNGYVTIGYRSMNGADPEGSHTQIERSYSATEYEQRSVTTVPADWTTETGTVYGGYLDLISGVLTATWAIADLGEMEYIYDSAYDRFKTPISGALRTGTTRGALAYCTCLKILHGGETYDSSWNNVGYFSNTYTFFIHYRTYTDPAQLATALSGQKLVYQLQTPITYQLSPVSMKTYIGRNTFWSDANGDTEVTYDLYESAEMRKLRQHIIAASSAQRMRLPVGYTGYDWVRTSGHNARIDTGVSGDNPNLKFEFDFMWKAMSNSYHGIFGNYKTESDHYCWRLILPNISTYPNPGFMYATMGNRPPASSFSVSPNGGSTILDTKVHCVMTYGSCTVTGTSSDTKTATTTTKTANPNNIAIGASSTTSSGGSSQARIYSFKIWDGTKLIRDYRPCVRNSDSKPGLYDVVNHQFCPSIGSADFTAGND